MLFLPATRAIRPFYVSVVKSRVYDRCPRKINVPSVGPILRAPKTITEYVLITVLNVTPVKLDNVIY